MGVIRLEQAWISNALEHFPAKWKPVSPQKMRPLKDN
jgi:hypothetical protein